MKKIKTAYIVSEAAMPIKKGTLDHLQSAYEEILFGLAQSELFQRTGVVIGYTTPQAMYGCGYSFSGTIWNIESGLIAFGSELFIAPTVVGINLSVGQVVIGTITTTNYTGSDADPVEFSDAALYNVLEIRKIVWSAGTSGGGDFDFLDVQYMGRWIEQTYSAGDLTASTGNWTIPGGAADFEVKTQRRGSTMIVDFYIASSTLSANPAYLSLSLSSTDRIKSTFRSVCYFKNPSALTTAGACKVEAVAGTRELRFTPMVVGTWILDTASVDVWGQITIEMDCNES